MSILYWHVLIQFVIQPMASGNAYFDDIRNSPEVVDPPQNEDMMDVGEHVNDPAQTALKPNVTVSSSVRELLECPVCLNAMYPPIHQVGHFMKVSGTLDLFSAVL